DLVVHHDVGDIYVAPHRVNKMTNPDPVAVAVSSSHHHVEIVIAELDSLGYRDRAPVQTVDPIGMKEARQVRRASDSGNDHQVLGFDTQPSRGHLEGFQYTEVTTARTPVGINNALVFLNR